MSELLTYLSAAYREIVSFEPLLYDSSPGSRRKHVQVISKANAIIGQMYAHIQGVSVGSAVEEGEELELDDGRGSWGRSGMYYCEALTYNPQMICPNL